MRTIIIKTVLNGWVAEVGCQKLVFDNSGVMLEKLRAYMTAGDRKATAQLEAAFIECGINNKITAPDRPFTVELPMRIQDILAKFVTSTYQDSEPSTIAIAPVLNGWLVALGSNIFAFLRIDDLLGVLRNFLADPRKATDELLGVSGNSHLATAPACSKPEAVRGRSPAAAMAATLGVPAEFAPQ